MIRGVNGVCEFDLVECVVWISLFVIGWRGL